MDLNCHEFADDIFKYLPCEIFVYYSNSTKKTQEGQVDISIALAVSAKCQFVDAHSKTESDAHAGDINICGVCDIMKQSSMSDPYTHTLRTDLSSLRV